MADSRHRALPRTSGVSGYSWSAVRRVDAWGSAVSPPQCVEACGGLGSTEISHQMCGGMCGGVEKANPALRITVYIHHGVIGKYKGTNYWYREMQRY